MHELQFADTARPTAIRILRLQLLEFSLGHEALLLQARNAFFVLPPGVKQFSDLPLEQQIFAVKTAVLVCSQNWAANQRPHRWLKLWGWLTRKENYPLAIAEFQNYLAAGRALPPPPDKFICEVLYGKDDDKGRMLGAPLLAQLYNFAVDNPRKCRAVEPWDASYAFTGTLYFSQLEIEGRARLENAAELDERLNYEKITREDEAKGIKPKSSENIPAGLASLPPDLED